MHMQSKYVVLGWRKHQLLKPQEQTLYLILAKGYKAMNTMAGFTVLRATQSHFREPAM